LHHIRASRFGSLHKGFGLFVGKFSNGLISIGSVLDKLQDFSVSEQQCRLVVTGLCLCSNFDKSRSIVGICRNGFIKIRLIAQKCSFGRLHEFQVAFARLLRGILSFG